MMWEYGGLGGFGMGIGMLLFWGLIIALIVMTVLGLGRKSETDRPVMRENTALDILGQRYARGEIDKAEFEEKRTTLSGH